MNGAFVIDKPTGMTSADVVRRLKRALRVKRIGHAGTLDPMATGILVVLVGHATRLQDMFLGAEKGYEGEILLGTTTDTDDVTGTTLTTAPLRDFTREELEVVRGKFVGVLSQLPPIYSALKVEGARAYDLARRGHEVELQPREITVSELELTALSHNTLRYRVRCSKGTYVRSLARDIGQALGVGGTLRSIRRVFSSPFGIEQASVLEEVEAGPERFFHPIETLLGSVEQLAITPETRDRLLLGDQSVLPRRAQDGPLLAALVAPERGFVGMVERSPTGGWKVKFLVPEGE